MVYMLLWTVNLFILYAIIKSAIDNSFMHKLQKENYKLLVEIRDLLKDK